MLASYLYNLPHKVTGTTHVAGVSLLCFVQMALGCLHASPAWSF